MNIQYYHKNIDSLGDATRQYIESKIDTLSDVTKISQVRVEIDQQKNNMFHMSVQLNSGSNVYYADADAEEVNGCIDQIQDELRSQIQRNKKKVHDLVRRGARSIKKKLTIDKDARF